MYSDLDLVRLDEAGRGVCYHTTKVQAHGPKRQREAVIFGRPARMHALRRLPQEQARRRAQRA